MRSTVLATGVTCTRAGSRSSVSARLRISFGMVALNIRLCRPAGSFATILRMSLMNPMSSMRSASSSTSTSTLRRSTWPLVHQVKQAAGRRDDDVGAAAQRVDLRVLVHAAKDGRAAKLQVLAVDAKPVGNLHRQFARRAEDETAGPFAVHDRPRCAR